MDAVMMGITNGLREIISEEFDKAVQEAQKNIEKRKAELITNALVSVSREMDYQSFQDRLVITLKK